MIETPAFNKMMRVEQRKQSKLANADRKKLKGLAREVYLQGFAKLGKCEEVAEKGNGGRGFKLPVIISEEYANVEKPAKKRKKGKKSD